MALISQFNILEFEVIVVFGMRLWFNSMKLIKYDLLLCYFAPFIADFMIIVNKTEGKQ